MKKTSLIMLFILIVCVITNGIAFNALPEKVGLQLNLFGELNNHVDKNLFIFIAPIVLLVLFLVSRPREERDKAKYLLVSVIAYAINLVMIFANIKG